MSALLPCPFCGGEARIDENISGDAWMVICPDEHCGVRSETAEWWSPQSAAIDRWNTRATPAEVAALRAEVARLREAMNKIARDRWEPRNPRASAGEQITDMITQIIQCAAAALEPTR